MQMRVLRMLMFEVENNTDRLLGAEERAPGQNVGASGGRDEKGKGSSVREPGDEKTAGVN